MVGIRKPKYQKEKGFTVVELLSVIIIIGILASIAIVTYSGYQVRTRDNERKSDVQQIAAALSAYVLRKNNYVGDNAFITNAAERCGTSGAGLNGTGNGWFNAGASESAGAGEGLGAYTKSIASCLEDVGLLRSGEFIDPFGCLYASGGQCGSVNVVNSPAQAYMKVTCKKGGSPITYVLTRLESEPRKDNDINALCDTGSVAGFNATTQLWGTRYGMNYYVVAK
jgi:prepilin-type N-terminal cleavage/methylation domain-containing protein